MKKEFILPSLFLVFILSLSAYAFYINKNHNKKILTKPALVFNATEKKSDDILLGRAEVSFSGSSSGRAKNIELGISRINGTVVLPGDEFSFKKVLGSVTEEEGFSEEKVFLNGEVTKGIGGGLCQVSTTLFQSALKAGLPITERKNHSYSVSYYDVGLDATYSDPGPDLRFLNDTGNPITIKGHVEDSSAVFEIYGVSDGRVSSTTEAVITEITDFPPTRYVATSTRDKSLPDCINKPQIGYTATISYSVDRPLLGTTTTQIFESRYKPLQRVCYISFTEAAEKVAIPVTNR